MTGDAFVDTSVILRILVKDDDAKRRACERLIKETRGLHILPVSIMEIVWVLEKLYKLDRSNIRELVESIMNTPGLKVEIDGVFRSALIAYEKTNIKFADAVMAHWGMERGLDTVYTYDEKHFKKIQGLDVRKP